MSLSRAAATCETTVPLSQCRSDNQKHLLCRRLQGERKKTPCATGGQTSFNEVGLHLAASHRSLLYSCHSAKAVLCQHARPYERPRNLHTYNMKSCLLYLYNIIKVV